MIFRENISENNYFENVNMKMENIMKSNKIFNLKVRVSKEEYEIIKQKCEDANCSNMSSYLIICLLYMMVNVLMIWLRA